MVLEQGYLRRLAEASADSSSNATSPWILVFTIVAACVLLVVGSLLILSRDARGFNSVDRFILGSPSLRRCGGLCYNQEFIASYPVTGVAKRSRRKTAIVVNPARGLVHGFQDAPVQLAKKQSFVTGKEFLEARKASNRNIDSVSSLYSTPIKSKDVHEGTDPLNSNTRRIGTTRLHGVLLDTERKTKTAAGLLEALAETLSPRDNPQIVVPPPFPSTRDDINLGTKSPGKLGSPLSKSKSFMERSPLSLTRNLSESADFRHLPDSPVGGDEAFKRSRVKSFK